MLFNSVEFIFIFLPLTLLGFFGVSAWFGHRAAIGWLVLASLAFYGWWNPVYLWLIGFSILFNYGCGILLSKWQTASNNADKWLLGIGVVVNLFLLGYFKYANFFVDNINLLVATPVYLETIVLPLAISFFTFQQIAYLVDAFRGETSEYDFAQYCLFVSFFPQLIAGPIVHHKEMLPQFAQSLTFVPRSRNLAVGITIFIIGLFKKVVIADNFALHATPVFSAAETGVVLSFFQAWEGAWAYTFQLYFDFSGYSDMAIGLARMFGIRLPVNFNSPYRAASIIEFWRCWHITLSRFLRDYLYFSLGGNRSGKIHRYANLMATMILGGAWHGAGWTFVVWGFLHGLFLIVNHMWRALVGWRSEHWVVVMAMRTITLLSVVVGWVFFRAETFEGALVMLRAMMNLPNALDGRLGFLQPAFEFLGFGFSGGWVAPEHYIMFLWLVFWLAIVWFWPNTQELMRRYRPVIPVPSAPTGRLRGMVWRPTWQWAMVVVTMAMAGFLGLSSVTEFLYFQF